MELVLCQNVSSDRQAILMFKLMFSVMLQCHVHMHSRLHQCLSSPQQQYNILQHEHYIIHSSQIFFNNHLTCSSFSL